MRFSKFGFLACGTLLLAACAPGQEPVSRVQDLVGARGTAVDTLEQRGFRFQHAERSADSAISFWLENASGRCVSARVTNGQIASIVYADSCVAAVEPLEAGFFETVCGVIRDGETFRYLCSARDDTENGNRTTTLRFPDNEMRLTWHDDRQVTIERAGLLPEQAAYSTSEGETDIFAAEMTFFYISNRSMAESEVRNFGGADQATDPLTGTYWQLVELQSMSDAIGVAAPEDASLYTMSLNDDGTANLRLDCNRGSAPWSFEATSNESGSFTLGPLAMTRALCPPGSLDQRLAREAEYVRSYLLRDGRLYLSLMADGGIQVWEPAAP